MWRSLCVGFGTLVFFLSSGTFGADTCVDYLGSQCQDTAVQEVVCKDTASAPQFCAKTCGLCPTDRPSTATTTSDYHTVTSLKSTGSCVDVSTQCDDVNVLAAICQDKETAMQLCFKSCRLCSAPKTKVTTEMSTLKSTVKTIVTTTIPTVNTKTTMPTVTTAKSTVTTTKPTTTTTKPTVTTTKPTMTTTKPTVKSTVTATKPSVKSTVTATKPTVTTTKPTVKSTVTTTMATTDHTLTTPTSTNVQPMATTLETCKDELVDCSDYGDTTYVCSRSFETWARINCAQYCGFCNHHTFTTPTSTTMLPMVTTNVPTSTSRLRMSTTQGPCKDMLRNCRLYGTFYCSGKYEPWAKSNCAQYCGYCNHHTLTTLTSTTMLPVVTTNVPTSTTRQPMSTTKGPCKDMLRNCRHYGTYCSGKYEPWAKLNCAKYCGYCFSTLPSTHMTTTRYLPTTVRTTAASTCTDSTDIDCTDPQVHSVVCMDTETATKLCPKTCGKCVVTTVDPCQDDPSGNCQDPDIKSFVCLDQDTARKLCPKTCNVCSKQNIGAPVVG